MEQNLIDRINALARKSKAEGLTEAEAAEQQRLRRQYVAEWRRGVEQQLQNTKIKRPDGTIESLKKRKK